jgi:hypothetical protein
MDAVAKVCKHSIVITIDKVYITFIPASVIDPESIGIGRELFARVVPGGTFEADIHDAQSVHVRVRQNNSFTLLNYIPHDIWFKVVPHWLRLPLGEATHTVGFDIELYESDPKLRRRDEDDDD